MQPEIAERQVQTGVSRLRRKAVAAMRGVKYVSDLSAGMLGAEPAQHHVADQLSAVRPLGTENERVPLLLEDLQRPRSFDARVNHAGVHRIEWHVPAHLRNSPVRHQRIHVSGR